MSAFELTLIVVFMAVVTYMPRMLPLVFLRDIKMPPYLRSCLQFIPYAILGALIFPGALYSTGNMLTAIAGIMGAAILAYCRLNLVIVVIGGIMCAYLSGLFL
ncbi:MAG: AzlD domain-containing protein [Syntrophomonadaceae bacterium]|nr:AzlD domain-containing protein [Syntrophomonadaceae bacterium]